MMFVKSPAPVEAAASSILIEGGRDMDQTYETLLSRRTALSSWVECLFN